jgi:hypothetical protein
VIWAHTSPRLEQDIFEFLLAVCSTETLMRLHRATGVLPARLDALIKSTEDPHYAAVWQTLHKGKPLPSTRLWGMIEHRLTDAFFNISSAVMANPSANIDHLLDEQLNPLERTINLALSS